MLFTSCVRLRPPARAAGTRRLPQVAAAVLTAWAAFAAPVLANPAENDAAMLKLAQDRGCMACHGILPAAPRADGLRPLAPAWRDVALKYRDDPGAYQRLTQTVLSGSRPGASHWVGKVGAVAMPPNAVAISEADAQMLVNWILVLVP